MKRVTLSVVHLIHLKIHPGIYWDGKGLGTSSETSINATMDFALAKEVLNHLIVAEKAAGTSGKQIEHWEEMLKKIPPYQINSDGAVTEWMHPDFDDNYHHRHMSHLYPVFPGREVNAENDPELFKAFLIALEKTVANWNK